MLKFACKNQPPAIMFRKKSLLGITLLFFSNLNVVAALLISSPINTAQASLFENSPGKSLTLGVNPSNLEAEVLPISIMRPDVSRAIPILLFIGFIAFAIALVLLQLVLKKRAKGSIPELDKHGVSSEEAGLKLQISEKDKAMTLNNVSDVVLFLSPDNNVKWANSHFFKTFNKAPHEVTGRPFNEVLPVTSEKSSVFDLDKQRRAGTLHREYFFPEGQKVFKASVNPVFNDRRQFEGFVKTMTDITLQKHIENLLVEAKEKAEQADNLKSTFLANMSHEIRTPMNAIVGFAELLELDDLSNRERREYLRIIRTNGQHLLMLISDILAFSQIETGQLQVARELTRVKPLIEEIGGQFREEVRKRSNGKVRLRVVTDFMQGDEIYTDVLWLRQILYNLMTNAIKFTEQGLITIGCKSSESDFTFFVKDTGIGIPEDKKQLVFKRFHQIANESQSKQAGSGLGLSICRELVYLIGGRIWVNSKVGKGSTFIFKLPA